MKKEELESKSTKKLKSELKKIQGITGVLIGVLAVLLAVTIYGLITKEKNELFFSLIVVAISCSAVLPLQFASIKKMKAELASRKNTD